MTAGIRKRHEQLAEYAAALASRRASHSSANACDGCRHWGGDPGSGVLGRCDVRGSFRAPGGLFTEGDFWCCHWTKG